MARPWPDRRLRPWIIRTVFRCVVYNSCAHLKPCLYITRFSATAFFTRLLYTTLNFKLISTCCRLVKAINFMDLSELSHRWRSYIIKSKTDQIRPYKISRSKIQSWKTRTLHFVLTVQHYAIVVHAAAHYPSVCLSVVGALSKRCYASSWSVAQILWRNSSYTVAALHQGTPGQMTWLEDPLPCLLLGFGSNVNSK